MNVPPPKQAQSRNLPPHGGELFIGRKAESRAFRSALAAFRRGLDSDKNDTARHNVMTFHGMGGIGKTVLSERMEAWVRHELPLVNGWGPPPSDQVHATCRIDLHVSGGQMDLLAGITQMRAGVAGIRRRWPVFDLAFAAYWSSVRPGEPLPTFRGRAELENVVAETTGEILKDLVSVADLALGTATTVGVRGIRKLIGVLRRRRDLQLAVDSYPGFEDFLLRCADEPSPTEPRPALVGELAALLSWELARMAPSPLLTVFVDTVERLALDPRRTSEGKLNRLIHDMPNVLFVLTGRTPLDWHDLSRVDLPYRGPWTWPGLLPGAPGSVRQHLVGNLSPSDTRALVLRGRELLGLPMGDDIVEHLVRASAGLPQYVALAREVAISIKDAGPGRTVRMSDVTGSLGALVMRVLDDVPADEQRAIRAAALFRAFDVELIAAAAEIDHGCAERAVRRPMIDHHDEHRLPYRMHDAVRTAIREAGPHVTGGWSERDWEMAATRAAAAIRRSHDVAKSRADNREVLDLVGMAIELVSEQDTTLEPARSHTYADWLTRAIVFSPSLQGLHARVPAASRTEYGRLVLQFIAAKSEVTPLDERVALLREVFEAEHPLRSAAGRHLGYTLRDHHRWEEALAVFDELATIFPTPFNRGQRSQALSMARRFADAEEAARGLPAEEPVRRVAEYVHGRPDRYFAEIPGKLDRLRRTGRQREYLEESGTYLVRRALLRNDLTVGEVTHFSDQAETSGHPAAIRNGLLATALLVRSEAAIERLRRMDEAARGEIGFRYALAECCQAYVFGAADRLDRLADEVGRLPRRSRSMIPVEFLLDAAGRSLPTMATQWLEPAEEVKRRWFDHFTRYRSRSRTA